jgi:hypothetical protein
MDPLISGGIAALLTLIVLSRIFGDSPIFRAAQYLFVGVSLGYVFVVLYYQALLPNTERMLLSIVRGDLPAALIQAVPFILMLLLIPRIAGPLRLSWLANFPLGLIFGVGVGLSLVGALIGTIIPQVLATITVPAGDLAALIGAIVLLIGIIVTLNAFFFTTTDDSSSGRFIRASGRIGRGILLITFGFFLAGALVTYLTALNERFNFLVGFFR